MQCTSETRSTLAPLVVYSAPKLYGLRRGGVRRCGVHPSAASPQVRRSPNAASPSSIVLSKRSFV